MTAVPGQYTFAVGGTATASTVLQADSKETLIVPVGQAFRIGRICATASAVVASAVPLRVFLNSLLAAFCVEATPDARRYASPPGLDLYVRPGDKMICLWDEIPSGSTGVLFTMTMTGQFVSNTF